MLASRPIVALTTDFGTGSTYVAQLKGVLLSIEPNLNIVDVNHDLPRHSIKETELLLRATAFAFPLGTTHVVVVDPGVGTSRRALAAAAHGMYFVGPDNGVLGGILSQPDARCVAIENQGLLRHPVSATFHGRDVFAPVAAELALGLALSAVGTPVIDALPSTLPSAVYSENTVTGEVLGADRFGNLLTNIASSKVPRHWRVSLAQYVLPFCRTYGDAPEKTPFILDGSEGFLEVAIKEGAAAEFFGSTLGCQIHCTDHEGN